MLVRQNGWSYSNHSIPVMFVTLCEVNSNGVKFFSEGSLLQKKKYKKKLSTASRSELPAKEEKQRDKKKRTLGFTFEKVNLIYDSTLSANDLFW